MAVALLLGPSLILGAIGVYMYRTVAAEVDARLAGLNDRVAPRIFARRFAIRVGQWLTPEELSERLDDLGYARRTAPQNPGEFSTTGSVVRFVPRAGIGRDRQVAVTLDVHATSGTGRVASIEVEGTVAQAELELEAPLLTGMSAGGRGRQRQVPLNRLPAHVVQAVLAIEDRRFYAHPGVDVIRTAGAIVTNIRGDRPYLVGGSTLTQQLVKNSFLTPEKSYTRKLREQVMSVVMERRLSKDQILELYLNDVYLGQRGSFAVHGMAEGARLFFGKDVTNLTLPEAATLAGIIQSPAVYSPSRNPVRARERRNVVLSTMVEAGYIDQATAARAADARLVTSTESVDAEAPYFVDHVAQVGRRGFVDIQKMRHGKRFLKPGMGGSPLGRTCSTLSNCVRRLPPGYLGQEETQAVFASSAVAARSRRSIASAMSSSVMLSGGRRRITLSPAGTVMTCWA